MSKTRVVFELNPTELTMLKHALEVSAEIANDTVTDPLFITNKETTAITVEELNQLRDQVDQNIDRMTAAQFLWNKVRDL